MRTPLAAALAAALACLPARLAAAPGAVKPEAVEAAGPETLLLVERFVSDKAVELPRETVARLMELDPKSLPVGLRAKFQARRLQLRAHWNQENGIKKGFFRRAGNDAPARCAFEEGSEEAVAMLRRMGFEQISEDEERYLMQKTKCSECELTEEYTLTMYFVPPKKKKQKTLRYLFLSQADPLMALLAAYRSGSTTGGTNFFGTGFSGGCR